MDDRPNLPRVSAILVAYGATPRLPDAIEAIAASIDVEVEIVVVDTGSIDGTIDRAKELGAKVVKLETNVGFGGGCNAGARASSGDVLCFVGTDVRVAPDALAQLTHRALDPGVGIASACVRLMSEPHLVNSWGGAIHFLGLGWADGHGRPITEAGPPRRVAAASGASMAMRRAAFEHIGGFTPELFLYHEDAEISLRCWLAGLAVWFVPEASVEHDYDFGRHREKLYYLERNRLILVLTCFERRTLVLLIPALAAFELGMTVVSLVQGWLPEKVRGWRWLVRNRSWLRRHRDRIQRTRVVGDREVAPLLASRFTAGQIDMPAALRPADWVLAVYWRAVSRLL